MKSVIKPIVFTIAKDNFIEGHPGAIILTE
jgi:hypothetical protein